VCKIFHSWRNKEPKTMATQRKTDFVETTDNSCFALGIFKISEYTKYKSKIYSCLFPICVYILNVSLNSTHRSREFHC
jgi:hypothetical protein